VAEKLWASLSPATQADLKKWKAGEPDEKLLADLSADINQFLGRPAAFSDEEIGRMDLPDSTREWLKNHPTETFARNWILLGHAFPGVVAMEYREEAIRRARRIFDWWQDTLDQRREIAIPIWTQEEIQRDVVGAYIETARVTQHDVDLVQGLQAMHRLKPDDERTVREMVNAYIRMERRDDLEEVLLSVLERDPMRLVERSYLAQLYVQTGRPRAALEQALILSRLDPGMNDIAYLRFAVARASGQDDEARKWGREYLQKGRNAQWKQIIEEHMRLIQ